MSPRELLRSLAARGFAGVGLGFSAASVISVIRLAVDQHYLFIHSSVASLVFVMDVNASIQPDLAVSQQDAADENAPPHIDDASVTPTIQPSEKWNKTVHPRGRQARDPLAQYVRFQCTGGDQMEALLHEYVGNPTSPAEHTTIEFSFSTSSAFMVYTGEYLGGSQTRTNLYGHLNRSALSVNAALSPVDKKESLKMQKSIAKTLVEHIAKADGYRYSFHNNWLSKEDGAHRFSYFCNDSTLNKGRAANEGAGMVNKRKMKPVYDCAGTIHVKFSVTKQSLELHYKHVPCHKTYEERAPTPRKNSKRRKIMEVFEPDKLVRERKRKAKAEKPPKSPKAPKAPKRRATEPLPGAGDATAESATDGLAPLLDFLGSADREAAGGQVSSQLVGEGGPVGAPPAYPAAKLNELKKATRRKSSTPRQGPVRSPRLKVPGMMSGYMSGDLITWGSKSTKGRLTEADLSASPSTAGPSAGPLAGIAQAAAEFDIADPGATADMSELDLLKAKLAAAEARINRLESEKGTPTSGPPGWPPPPAPASYAYPPPQFGNVPYQHVQSGPPHGFPYPHSPSQGQASPQLAPPARKAVEARMIQFNPTLVSGGGRKGRPLERSNEGEPQRPPGGGQIVYL